MDHYQAASVRFVAPTPHSGAAAGTLCNDEAVGTNISLGSFGAEISLLTHTAAAKAASRAMADHLCAGSGRAVSGAWRRRCHR